KFKVGHLLKQKVGTLPLDAKAAE
ncbi:MAG: hypothetical protein RLZZ127_1918, partial [Planctomycetota bacterium]